MDIQRTFGYIRVSSREQNEDRQLVSMHEFGVLDKNLYFDKQSGKDFERPKYRQLMKRLKPGDVLVIKSIDRLGRNYIEILDQWRYITKEKQVSIVVLDMPLLDTRKGLDLTGTFIADLVLQLLSYVAETERNNIRQRQAEGIAAAKARGVHFGRPPMIPPEGFTVVRDQYRAKRITSREAASILKISPSTFLRWVKGQRGSRIPLADISKSRVNQP